MSQRVILAGDPRMSQRVPVILAGDSRIVDGVVALRHIPAVRWAGVPPAVRVKRAIITGVDTVVFYSPVNNTHIAMTFSQSQQSGVLWETLKALGHRPETFDEEGRRYWKNRRRRARYARATGNYERANELERSLDYRRGEMKRVRRRHSGRAERTISLVERAAELIEEIALDASYRDRVLALEQMAADGVYHAETA